MTKRRKFLLVALILALGVLGTQLMRVEYRYQALLVLGFLAYGLSAWSLFDDLKGIEWLTILALPTLYPISVGLFYFLLPERFLSRIFVLALFGVGMYALLLTENIFSVAAIRTIQLLRAAHAVGFLITLVTSFFLFDTIWSFRWPFWVNGVLVGVVSFPILLQGLWSVELTEGALSRRNLLFGGLLSLAMVQVAVGLSFWPVSIAVGSLFLVAMLYVALGIAQQYFMGRLFRKTLYEYVGVGVVVLLILTFLTPWG